MLEPLGDFLEFSLPFHQMMEHAKQQFAGDFFMDIFMLGPG
jgi:hypothetical protein